MPRYFTKPPRTRVGDDVWEDAQTHLPMVSDHQAIDTGLLDLNGNAIMRAPNPIGFGKDDEW